MNEIDQLEQSLRRNFAPHEPSPGVRENVLRLRKHSNRKPLWVVCGATGLAAAAGLAIFLVLPATSLAEAVIKQAGGFEGHLNTFTVLPNGSWQKTGELWTRAGKQRALETGSVTFEYLRDTRRGYDIRWSPDQGKITIRDAKNNRDPGWSLPEMLTPDTLKDFLKRHGFREAPTTTRTQFNGRAADCVSLSMGPNFTTKLYADPVSHRLFGWSHRMAKASPQSPAEQNYNVVFVEDQKPIPAHIFDPVFNIGGVPTDVIAERAKWQEKLSKPLLVVPVKLSPRPLVAPRFKNRQTQVSRTELVAVRSVVVNRLGDVFVLFTGVAGEYGTNVIPMKVHDSTGGRYKKSFGFAPSEDGANGSEHFSFDGKPLEGAWFVRLDGGPVQGPISVEFKQEFEPESKPAFNYAGEPERISGDIPAYMPYMGLPIGTSKIWLEERTDEFASDRERAKDFAGEEKWLRKEIALQEKDGRSSRSNPPDLFVRLARALEQEGKSAEAYATYQKASKALAASEFQSGPWAKDQITAGLARLKK